MGRQFFTYLCLFVWCLGLQAQDEKILALLQKLETAELDTTRVNAYNALSRAYRDIDREKAYQYAYEAEKIANIISYQRGLGEVFENYSMIAYRKGDLQVAHDHARQCLTIAEQTSDSSLISLAYSNIGLVQKDLGNTTESLKCFDIVLRHERGQGITEGLARALMNTGAVLYSLDEMDNAGRFFREAKNIGRQLKDTAVLVAALNNLGSYHQKNKQLDSAMYRYSEARSYAAKIENHNYWGTLAHNMGWLYLNLGRYDTSFKYLSEALDIAQKFDLLRIEAATLGSLAEHSFRQAAYAEAIAYGLHGYNVAKTTSRLELSKKALKPLHKSFFATGQYDSAYKYLHKYSAVNDSILALQENKRIKQLSISNEIAQKDFQLAQQKAKVDQEQKQTRRLTIAFFITTSLLLGLAYTWYRLRRANIQLEGHNNKIQTQHEQLTELNQIKDRVFSIISHDIRAPLNNIKGLMDILLVHALEEEQRQMIAGKVKKQVRETSDIFDNLLRWSRNQLLKNQTEASSFDIVELFKESADTFTQQATQKEIKLICAFPPQLFVFADREMIHTVIRNLLSNAIKFSPFQSEIRISHHIEGTSVILHVADQGMGIESGKLATIFDLKQNVSTPGTADERGTGLGLPISKEFIEQNGGSMWAQSILGEGSTFSFSLPMNPKKALLASEAI
ncbi:MAG: ATP-binding protein [Bacteroidota bacterium]